MDQDGLLLDHGFSGQHGKSLSTQIHSPRHFTQLKQSTTQPSAVNSPPLSYPHSLLGQLKSINFYQQTDIEPENTSNQASLARAPSFLECVKFIKFPSFYNPGEANLDTESDHEDVDGPAEDHVHGPVRRIRSESERMEQQGPKPMMRKMASKKSAAAAAAEDFVEVEELDAKADNFIQRFRQQLRLQRLDSLMRYKDLLSGGGTGAAR